MQEFFSLTVIGIVTGAVYAVAASGLVVTYTTSGVFNFGHGAVGMIVAFMYWQVRVDMGLPTWLSLLLVLGVFAPLLGMFLERVMFRRLTDASVAVSLVVTVGLLVILLGVGQTIWPGNEARTVSQFFPGSSVEIANVNVTAHQLITLALGVGVAVGLRLLLFTTRVGVAMRAVVDNRELAAENGIRPERVSAIAWSIGTILAGIAGILIAPDLTLNHVGLTLLVINGYAAAILGQLRSLPLTFGGAMILGCLQSYLIGYGPNFDFGRGVLGNQSVPQELVSVVPVLFLLAVLVFLPQARLRVGRVVGAATPRVPDLRRSGVNAAVFLAAMVVVGVVLPEIRLVDATAGLVAGMVMLSIVLLTGYGGQIALCQFTFVGIGALVTGKLFADGQLLGIVVAGLVTACIGALVALPALRLQDLYLALVTFSVALFADQIVFDHPDAFTSGGNVFFDQMKIGPVTITGDRGRFYVAAVGFAAFAVAVLAIRRSEFGRRIAAMSDSPAAAATLGMNILGTKVAVFAVSAFLAGAAGGLFAISRGSAGALDFNAIQSLVIFLLATLGGVTTVIGAFIGGSVFGIIPIIQREVLAGTAFENVDLRGIFIGGGAILISRYPNGFAGIVIDWFAGVRERVADHRREDQAPVDTSQTDLATAPS